MFKALYAWLTKPNKSVIRQYIEAFIILAPLAFFIRTFFYGLYVVPSGSMETTMLVGDRFLADKFTVWFKPIKYNDIISFNAPMYPYAPKGTFKNWFQKWVWGPDNWTKRVIGLPGDHMQGKIEDGKPVVYRNGVKLDEPYVNKYPLLYTYKVDPQELRAAGSRAYDVNTRTPYSPKTFDPSKPFDKQPFYIIKPERIISNRFDNKPIIHTPDMPMEDGSDEFDVILKSDEIWAMGDNRKGSYDSRGWGPLKMELIHGKIIFRLFSIDSDSSWFIFDMFTNPVEFFFKRVRWSRFLQPLQ